MKPSNYNRTMGALLAGGVGVVASMATAASAWKQSVRVATTAAITIATDLNAGDTIDGVTLAAGDRVLVKDQGTASQNGIYLAGATPARTADMDSGDEALGAIVFVTEGTANGGTVWICTTPAPITIDTTDLTFTAFPSTTAAADEAMVPYNLASGTFTVPVNKQALFAMTITVASGASLVVDGYLLEVT